MNRLVYIIMNVDPTQSLRGNSHSINPDHARRNLNQARLRNKTGRPCPIGLTWVSAVLLAGALLLPSAAGFCQVPDTLLPTTDGVVNSIVNDGNTIYLGGNFNYIGPYSGGGVLLNNTTGAERIGFPKVNGRVHAVIPDGMGGWYVGGQFLRVGGFPLNDLAHINADMSVDTAWNPDVQEIGERYVSPKGAGVYALAISRGILYVGGDFNRVGGQTRMNLAAINLSTGTVTSWNPDVEGPLPADVYTIAIAGNRIYIGGSFTSINGQTRWNAGSVYATSGKVTYWDPDGGTEAFNGPIYSMVIVGSLIYLGGDFQNPTPLDRYYLVAFDTTQDYGVDILANWNPRPDSTVRTLAVNGSTIYAGGDFTRINGQSRNHFAAITTSGTVTGGNPGANGEVDDITVSGTGSMYVAGNFTSIGGQTRNGIAAVDGAGDATGWNPQAPPLTVNDSTKTPIQYDRFDDSQWPVETVGASGSGVYVGGAFQMWGGEVRNHLAAIDAETGAVKDWNPDADRAVTILALKGSDIYAGGDFTKMGGQTRNHVAEIDKSTGEVTHWNPDANGTVNSFAFEGSTIYVGGRFTSIGGAARTGLAAVDSSSGKATSWDPDLSYLPYASSGNVNALAISPDSAGNSILYVGGSFNSINSSTRNNIAALNLATGNLTGWNPDADTTVTTLAVEDTVIYAGGYFTSIGGTSFHFIAGIGKATGKATWVPGSIGYTDNFNTSVHTIVVSGSIFYVGGYSLSMGNLRPPYNFTNDLAAFNASNGVTINWHPIGYLYTLINTISLDSTRNRAYVGGASSYANNVFENFEGYTLPADTVLGIRTLPSSKPTKFALLQNYPNPFNPSTIISYRLPATARVTLVVYDVLGRKVRTLVSRVEQPGSHSVTFNAEGLPSGVYFYRLESGSFRKTKKLLLLR